MQHSAPKCRNGTDADMLIGGCRCPAPTPIGGDVREPSLIAVLGGALGQAPCSAANGPGYAGGGGEVDECGDAFRARQAWETTRSPVDTLTRSTRRCGWP